MPVYNPYPKYINFTDYTPVVPELYWNVYSAEERIKALCLEWVKLTAYVDGISDTINDQYDIIQSMQDNLPELVDEYVVREIEELISKGEFKAYVDAAIEDVYNTLVVPRQNTFENTMTNRQSSFESAIDGDISDIRNTTNATLAEYSQALNLLTTRVNDITHLPSGSTSGDAELIDIRTAWNNVVYDNAGTSVRTQVKDVVDHITTDVTLDLQPGYYNAQGTVIQPQGETLEYYTQKIPVNAETEFICFDSHAESHYTWLAYNCFGVNGRPVPSSRTVVHQVTKAEVITPLYGADILEKFPTTAFIALSWRSYGDGTLALKRYDALSDIRGDVDSLTEQVTEIKSSINDIDVIRSQALEAYNPLRFKKNWDHLFIDTITTGNNVIIPSESMANIDISKKLGFDVIELNCLRTSDNVYYVLHGRSGAFGRAFKDISDASIDLNNVAVSSVTSQYVENNIRFKSNYAKYQTAPLTAEKAFLACKANGLIPIVGGNDENLYALACKILGKNNFIYYNYATTRGSADTILMKYHGESTKEAMLEYCNTFGAPLLYCMSNSRDYSDSDLKDAIRLLHENGYLIGIAGCYLPESEYQRCMKLGMDFSASGWHVNEIQSPTEVISNDVTFDGFYTNGTVENGIITLAPGNIVRVNTTMGVWLAGSNLDIKFNGSITINFGRKITNAQIDSDGSLVNHFSTYLLNEMATFEITANATTQISSLYFAYQKV